MPITYKGNLKQSIQTTFLNF